MSNKIVLTLGWLAMLVAFVAGSPAHAGAKETLESLLMPGELSKAHMRYEKTCDKCHENFKKANQNKRCLDCHKDVNTDIVKKIGWHGRVPNMATRECKSCHTEHKGRDKDIADFSMDTFNHAGTDFELRGRHDQLVCTACHRPEDKYRDAKSACIDCHRPDDGHKERMGVNCQNCHVEISWRFSRFNHDKTKFQLKEKHKDVLCDDCHPNERYVSTPKECYFCHELDDKHREKNGRKCDTCHSDKGWTEIKFDHDKDTRFKLEDMHGKLICEDCHKDNVFEKKVSAACYNCHKLSDKHQGRYGKECQICHATSGWVNHSFDHNEDTKFRLRGKHANLYCEDCHKGLVFKENLGQECITCHKQDDVHRGQEGKDCERCHDERGWPKKVVFDHAISRFPLNGTHVFTTCEECHVDTSYKDAKIDCLTCHRKDDDESHKERMGAKCERCHQAFDWLAWSFDHDKDTDFKLDGAHEGIDCHSCHDEKIKNEKFHTPSDCYACHRKEDVHEGNLGSKCDRCHITETWKKQKLN